MGKILRITYDRQILRGWLGGLGRKWEKGEKGDQRCLITSEKNSLKWAEGLHSTLS